MKRASVLKLKTVVFAMALVILSACGQASPATPMLTLTTTPTASPTSTITPIPTNTNTPEPTPTEAVKQFPMNSAENYMDCYVAPEDLRAFADFRKEQLMQQGLIIAEPDPQKIIAVPMGESQQGKQGRAFSYVKLRGVAASMADRPYYTGDAFCYTELDHVWEGYDPVKLVHAVTTVAFPIPGKPGEFVVNPVIIAKYLDESEEDFQGRLSTFLHGLSLFVVDGGHKPTGYRIEPISTQNELAFPDLYARMDAFSWAVGEGLQGIMDPTVIDGIILEAFSLRDQW